MSQWDPSMDFQYPCRNMLRLLFLLLKFQLGWNLTAVAHILSSIVLISELPDPCLPWHPYPKQAASSFTLHFSPNSKQPLCSDRWCESLALVPCLRSLLSECRKHQTLVLPRCFLPLPCVEVSLETVDRQLLCWPVSSPFLLFECLKCLWLL